MMRSFTPFPINQMTPYSPPPPPPQVYMHLFSDALTYSTRFLNGSYQLRRVINLKECQVR